MTNREQKDRIVRLRFRSVNPRGETQDERIDDWEKTIQKLYWAGGLKPSEIEELKAVDFDFGKQPKERSAKRGK